MKYLLILTLLFSISSFADSGSGASTTTDDSTSPDICDATSGQSRKPLQSGGNPDAPQDPETGRGARQ